MPQDVLHVLIHCDYPAVKKKRESFWRNTVHMQGITLNNQTVQIRELLNLDPQCHEEDKLSAQNIMCSFVNHVCYIVNTSLSE